jgi:hypothetical protein
LQLARLSRLVDDLLRTPGVGADIDAALEWSDAAEAWQRARNHDGPHAHGEGGNTSAGPDVPA